MSMETSETDLDLIYMSDWSAEMHGHDPLNVHHPHPDSHSHSHPHPQQHPDQQQQQMQSQPRSNDIPPTVSYANVFPSVRDDNDGDTVSSNTPMPFGMKKNVIPTIATIYEPKFFEIYQQYYQHILHNEPELIVQNPNQHHLMTLCLNYLLSFSNWAREAVNGNWIRATLFENPDMRPEVRNGLAMIIVYVFASARAADARAVDPSTSTDMFTVLMKAESGMGIVNKTSLKIYSDPFGYFNFIKTCLSGLIDASAIPENERISAQATKKSRRGSRNQDEVEAYQYVKTQLIAMFQSPDSLQLAKDRINQILEFWHMRGKTIRNERFTSVFSLPPPVPGSGGCGMHAAFSASQDGTSSGNGNGNGNSGGNPPIFNTLSAEYITIPNRANNNRTSNRSSQGSGTNDSMNNSGFSFNSQQPQQPSTTSSSSSSSQSQAHGFGMQGNYGGNHHPASSSSYLPMMMYGSGQQQQQQQQPHPYLSSQPPSHVPVHLQVNDNDSVVSDSGVSSASRSPHPSFLEYHSSSARSSGAINFRYTNATSVSAPEDHSMLTSARPTEVSISFFQTQQFLQQQVQQVATTLPIPALRFDRQGMLSWSVTTSLIYDVESLLQQNNGRTHFYLVDEQKVKRFLAQEVIAKSGHNNNNNQHHHGAATAAAAAIEEEVLKASTFPLQISYQQAAMGFGSMEKMLLKSSAVATSWQGAVDATQMRVFVEGWRNHVAASIVQHNYNHSNNNSGRRSASNSLVFASPPGTTTSTTSASVATASASASASAAVSGATSSADANSTASMMMDDNASVVSTSSNSRQPRLSRRRPSGGLDIKRDMTKLALQLQQQELHQSNAGSSSLQLSQPLFGGNNAHSNIVPAMFSPPKGMSPVGPSPSFTFGKSLGGGSNNNANNAAGSTPTGVMTSPLAGFTGERKSFNNNNSNNNNSNSNNPVTANNSFSAGPNSMTMLDYWQFLNTGINGANAIGTTAPGIGRGIFVFERSNEVGLVIRANAQYGITEDFWCLYYPDDAMQQFLTTAQQYDAQDRLAQSFAAYLMQLLPQTRQLMKYLVPSAGTSGTDAATAPPPSFWQGPITVSYYAHTFSPPPPAAASTSATSTPTTHGHATAPPGGGQQPTASMGPPSAPTSTQMYRTLGSIDQNAHLLLSKLTADAYFHEIILF